MAGKRKKIDWEAIRREYRKGQFSNVELAHLFGCSEGAVRKRAKQDNWEKNLADRVQEATKEKLVRGEVRDNVRSSYEGSGARKREDDDQSLVDEAATINAEIVRGHRTDIGKLDEVCKKLMKKINDYKVTKDLKEIKTLTEILRNLTQTRAKVIELERQAFNIDGERDGKETGAITFISQMAMPAPLPESEKKEK